MERALKRRTIGPKELSNYDMIVSNPLATRYVAQFMHRTGLLAQFQHTEQEESDDETEDLDLEVIVQSPEDDGHYPMLATTVEGGENLDSLLEYTVPDRADALNGRKNITPNRGRSEDVGELGLILLQQELAGGLIKRCSHV
ncbi:uncharacterized protein N7500_001839 [Penicillium coprophilum]|uniref:uncharacterized protein n=1 Tax=Penicillium coprophilum TaxID=36646 RepID=UPI00238847B0|nr:uncharacterized protein N7500_001839 [Penicillium coprophilum]KAJ5173908.1 hypothetical protein N7500_001839 [Penicillium coprophilum]